MNLDAKVNNEIFRKNHPIILASNRHLATIYPVRLKHDTGGYLAGQVLVRNASTTYYEKYSASSGSYDAACILFEDVDGGEFAGSTGNALARGVFGGEVFKAKLIDYDSGVATDLSGRVITGADGVDVFKF